MILGSIPQKEFKRLVTEHKVKRMFVLGVDAECDLLRLVYKDNSDIGIYYINKWKLSKDKSRTDRTCYVIEQPEYNALWDEYKNTAVALFHGGVNLTCSVKDFFEVTSQRDAVRACVRYISKQAVNTEKPRSVRLWLAEKAYALQFILKDERLAINKQGQHQECDWSV